MTLSEMQAQLICNGWAEDSLGREGKFGPMSFRRMTRTIQIGPAPDGESNTLTLEVVIWYQRSDTILSVRFGMSSAVDVDDIGGVCDYGSAVALILCRNPSFAEMSEP